MNAGWCSDRCFVECGRFLWLHVSAHQDTENIWQVMELCRQRGSLRRRRKAHMSRACAYLCVCAQVCVCGCLLLSSLVCWSSLSFVRAFCSRQRGGLQLAHRPQGPN